MARKEIPIALSHTCDVAAVVVNQYKGNELLHQHLLEAAQLFELFEQLDGFSSLREKAQQPSTSDIDLLESAISDAAKLLGRKGGLKGGKARAQSLTPERRSEIASKAARTRWAEKSHA